jgi:hypothetical protein
MGWTKREVDKDLVILGDGEGNVTRVSGLLASVTPDQRYPDNKRFALVQKDGSVKSVAGSAAINGQLYPSDVGKFVKLTFDGWGHSGNGKFKKINVEVYEGEATPEMQAWPRFKELQWKAAAAAGSKDEPPPPDPSSAPDESDLPF